MNETCGYIRVKLCWPVFSVNILHLKGNNLQKFLSSAFNPSVFIPTNLDVFSMAVFAVEAEEISGNISRVYLEACLFTAQL